MTMTVGAYEAKTHFAELLDRVVQGETITVSRHGLPIAQLGPIDRRADDIRQAVADIKRVRTKWRLNGLDLTTLKQEGRR